MFVVPYGHPQSGDKYYCLCIACAFRTQRKQQMATKISNNSRVTVSILLRIFIWSWHDETIQILRAHIRNVCACAQLCVYVRYTTPTAAERHIVKPKPKHWLEASDGDECACVLVLAPPISALAMIHTYTHIRARAWSAVPHVSGWSRPSATALWAAETTEPWCCLLDSHR